jgi:hypothetical protein
MLAARPLTIMFAIVVGEEEEGGGSNNFAYCWGFEAV